MEGQEIKELINFNNKKIEQLLDPTTFVLQPEVQQLLDENQKLRTICPHIFTQGVCMYCGMDKKSLK